MRGDRPATAVAPPRAAVLVNWRVHTPFALATALAQTSGWAVDTLGGPFPRRLTRWRKWLLAWPAYLWVPLAFLARARRYRYVVAWQQVYGLVLALASRLLPWPQGLRICILGLIVTPGKRRGPARRLLGWALGSPHVAAAICYNAREAALYRQVFPLAAHKIVDARLSDDIGPLARLAIADEGYFVAAGRSNRDHDFLLEVFAGLPDRRLRIVCDDFAALRPLPPNVEVLTHCFGDDYLRELARCHAVVMAFHDETMSSGQLVFLHAAQLGKPVVATRSHALDGYLEDGVDGLVVDKRIEAFRAELAALDDPARHRALAEAAQRRWAERFGFAALARGVHRLLTS
jgi:glycosyltransferase involved in cell wall biosynthesis